MDFEIKPKLRKGRSLDICIQNDSEPFLMQKEDIFGITERQQNWKKDYFIIH